jgi:hypothetical protein
LPSLKYKITNLVIRDIIKWPNLKSVNHHVAKHNQMAKSVKKF